MLIGMQNWPWLGHRTFSTLQNNPVLPQAFQGWGNMQGRRWTEKFDLGQNSWPALVGGIHDWEWKDHVWVLLLPIITWWHWKMAPPLQVSTSPHVHCERITEDQQIPTLANGTQILNEIFERTDCKTPSQDLMRIRSEWTAPQRTKGILELIPSHSNCPIQWYS